MSNKNISVAVAFAVILVLSSLCLRQNIFGIIVTSLLSTIFLCDDNQLRKVYEKFYIIFTITTLISLIVYFSVNFGASLPYQVVPPLNALKSVMYKVYPFLVTTDMSSLSFESLGNQFRFFGVFDEPGVVGTLTLLLLIIEKFNLKVFGNIVLFVAGLVSMSLFFYLASFCYLLYFLFFKRQIKIKYKLLIILILAAFCVISMEFYITKELIWDRLLWDSSNQTITGMDRAGDDIRTYWSNIRGTSKYFFGIGDLNYYENRFMEDASIYNALVMYGIVVIVLYFIFFAKLIVSKIGLSLQGLMVFTFIYLTLWQRPGFFNVEYLFLFLIFVNSQTYRMPTHYE